MRRTLNWFKLISACGLAVASGCAAPATNSSAPQGQVNNGWHWPGTTPAPAQPAIVMPKPAGEDPTALSAKTPKLGPDLYVATAHVYEQAGNADSAAEQYEHALQMDPKYLPALLGYAHLKDSQEQFAAADKLYETAVQRNSKLGAGYNDWALSLEHRKKHREALEQLSHAIAVEPDKTLYRNNMAEILIQVGRTDEALKQLTAVHTAAAAHYNLAILLHRKGDDTAAREHFAIAAHADPTMTAAAEWAHRLDPMMTRAAQVDGSVPSMSPIAAQAGGPDFVRATPAAAYTVDRVSLANRRPIVADEPSQGANVTIGDGAPVGDRMAVSRPADNGSRSGSQPTNPFRYPQYMAAPAVADGPLPPSPDDAGVLTAERLPPDPRR